MGKSINPWGINECDQQIMIREFLTARHGNPVTWATAIYFLG